MHVGPRGVEAGEQGPGRFALRSGNGPLRPIFLLGLLGLWLGHVAVSQTIRVENARMPKGLAPLQMMVGGRVQVQADDEDSVPGRSEFVYQWPGTYFQAAFRGKALYFRTGNGRQGLRLTVDHGPAFALVSSHPSVYRVQGLARGSHTVRLAVVTESQAGAAQFYGFAVRAKDSLSPSASEARQIEFIGDSYTVGYGNTSATRSCSSEEIWATTDDAQAFGPVTAEHFGADYQVNAISGRGVVRNYNGGKSDTLPEVYPFVLFDKKQAYEDAGWKPQVVVVGLGTNDFSTPLNVGEPWATRVELHTAYESTFIAFLNRLRERNPRALFVIWATDGEHGEVQSEAGKVVARLKENGDERVEFVPVSGLKMSGCDGHPSIADDKAISLRLREAIESHPDVWQRKTGLESMSVTEP